ncbi:MAG: 1-acyl-sn-glycerol-3-phosphate acyltransferase [Rhodobacteraceae bacterium]|nr:1-acyl-sn-glycerol-3-phosphate acyltransferase [Paracoccaceae bacterium]
MMTTVELPLWALLLILAFAAVAALNNVLVPSVRWFLRRRLERAVERLNARLKTPIQPFKLARRNDTILRLTYDPEVARAVVEYARENGIREDVASEKAAHYAREIVPGFSAFTYFGFAIRAARFLSQSLYHVRLVQANDAALEVINPEATVIFVMNHRSNMDYVLVTWLAAERSALAYAVGEWARVWPLRQLIRAMGGYFIRRRHNNALYRTVLARYVQMATEAGVTQAVFPEGGLSRTGALGKPKTGLISCILDGFTPGESRDVVFVPVALNYDRVIEDRTLIEAHANGTRRFRFRLWPFWCGLLQRIRLRITGQIHRYGYAAVSFGQPLSLTMFLDQPHGDPPTALGDELMQKIGAVMPVLPVPLVAYALTRGAGTSADLKEAVGSLVKRLQAEGRALHTPGGDLDDTIRGTLRVLADRRVLAKEGEHLTLTEGGQGIARFYAASIAHLLDAPPAAAAALANSTAEGAA